MTRLNYYSMGHVDLACFGEVTAVFVGATDNALHLSKPPSVQPCAGLRFTSSVRERGSGDTKACLRYWKKLTHRCQMELDSNSEPLTTFVSLSTSLNVSEPMFLPVW